MCGQPSRTLALESRVEALTQSRYSMLGFSVEQRRAVSWPSRPMPEATLCPFEDALAAGGLAGACLAKQAGAETVRARATRMQSFMALGCGGA